MLRVPAFHFISAFHHVIGPSVTLNDGWVVERLPHGGAGVGSFVARFGPNLHGGVIMLVLSRRIGEEIVIADNVRVTVVAIHGDKVRLGITAPRSVRVDRAEVHARRAEFADEDESIEVTVAGA